MLNFSAKMTNSSHSPKLSTSELEALLEYPCTLRNECSAYRFWLPPGLYYIECYGASSSRSKNLSTTTFREGNGCISQDIVNKYKGNTICAPGNSPGSGGYMSGTLTVSQPTLFYANIGGAGQYNINSKLGGFNGGGGGNRDGSSGGGATDLRVGENDVYHRIIVAAGGGGSDNDGVGAGHGDDGSGGSGGYPEGQGYWISGTYISPSNVTQMYGFSFGQGENLNNIAPNHPNSSKIHTQTDTGGGGGGWFGGFTSGNCNGGGSGGSSFILKKDASIPKGIIAHHNGDYQILENGTYAFDTSSKYVFENISHASGIWFGNGQMRITLKSMLFNRVFCTEKKNRKRLELAFIFVFLLATLSI